MSGYGAFIGTDAALQSFINTNRALEADAQSAQRFGWEKQTAEAGLSTLADRTAAADSGAQLQNAQNQAGLSLVQPETRLKAAQTQSLYDKARIESALSDADFAELPKKIMALHQKGVLSQAETGGMALSTLANMIQAGADDGEVKEYMNDWNEASGQPRNIASVGIETVNGKKTLIARDATGNVITSRTADELKAAQRLFGGGKSYAPKLQSVTPGASLVQTNPATGKVETVYTAPESGTQKAQKQSPMERDVNYLVKAFGMTPAQALDRLQSTKSMSKEAYVMKYVQDSRAMGRTVSKDDIKAVADEYDAIQNLDSASKAANRAARSPRTAKAQPALKKASSPQKPSKHRSFDEMADYLLGKTATLPRKKAAPVKAKTQVPSANEGDTDFDDSEIGID
jgi:hypothetical protein